MAKQNTIEIFSNQIQKPQAAIDFEIGKAFPNSKNKPLSLNPRTSLVQAIRRPDENNRIYVYTINFVANKNKSLPFNASYTKPQKNAKMLDIEISYDLTPVTSSAFDVYQLAFYLDDIPTSVTEITVTLVDTDPRTSRGTVTTVQEATPTI